MTMTTFFKVRWKLLALGLGAFAASAACEAQVSLATAVDLALSHSPKVRIAAADLDKAKAALAQTHDVYIPNATAGGGYGDSWGFSANPPTLFTFTAQALVYNAQQHSNIRSAGFGVRSAELALEDARQGVAEDVAEAYLALQHDQRRELALVQQDGLAERLVEIVGDRIEAGQDNGMELTRAKLTAAQIHLAELKAQDDAAVDVDHLALLLGIAASRSLTADQPIPAFPTLTLEADMRQKSAGVRSAFANADAKFQTATGDSHYRFRPQIEFFAQYNRYATFTKSFQKLQEFNPSVHIGANQEAIGVQIQLPLYDRGRRDKAIEEAAEARRSQAEAENAEFLAEDGSSKLRHSLEVLRARTEVARLDQQLAEQQLEALTAQLNAGSGSAGGAQLSPKDEQTSRIAEREKYLSLIDAEYQLQQSEIQLLRQTGQLEAWLKQAAPAVKIPTP